MRSFLVLLALLIGFIGCEKKSAEKAHSSSSMESSVSDEALAPEDCDDKAKAAENKAEEAMMDLQGSGDAGCAIE